MPKLFAVAVGASVLFAAAQAQAEVKTTKRTTQGDVYEFRDDLLNSDVAFPKGGTIVVRFKPPRATLIRPRVSFVPELLKSVEHM